MINTLKSILIIDDEIAIRRSIAYYFEDNLWVAEQAESAEEALIILKTKQISASIVDPNLENLGGIQFIKNIYDLYPEMVFIIYTGCPEFKLPQEFENYNRVSSEIFIKPLKDLKVLEQEILKIQNREENNKS